MKLHAPLLAAALFALGAFAQENSILALPGQAEGTAIDLAETRRGATHKALRYPFIMCYYVEPTVTAGQTGRFRACTFENCILKGPDDHYTDCTIGPGCTRAKK